MSTFSTERLKQLVSYAIQGAGFNKLLELSNFIGIRVDDGVLYFNTTDGTNYLSVSDSCVADDMDVTVNADTFSKLVGKINSETVELEVDDNALIVKGNGKYSLELVVDDEGNPLSFPDKFPGDTTDIGKITAHDIIAINTTVKPSLSSVAGSIYSYYFFGDFIAGTDKIMMSTFNRKIFDTPYLLDRKFVELMGVGASDVALSRSDDMLVAEATIGEKCGIAVCTPVLNDIEEFNIDAINQFSAFEVPSFCRFKKSQMLELLDRLSLFVSKFDEGAIELHFTDKYVEVSSIASSGIERVEYTESKDVQDITFKINIDRLRNQLKAYSSDVVDLYYGNKICIKLIDGDMTQIIALMKST